MRSAYQKRNNSHLHRTLSENFRQRRIEQDAVCDMVFCICVILLCVYICFIAYYIWLNKFYKGFSQNTDSNNTNSQNETFISQVSENKPK